MADDRLEHAVDVLARQIAAKPGEPRAAHQAMRRDDWQQVKQRHQQVRDEIRAAYAPTEAELEAAFEYLRQRGQEGRQS